MIVKNARMCICPRCGWKCSSRGNLSRHQCRPLNSPAPTPLAISGTQQVPATMSNSEASHHTSVCNRDVFTALLEREVDDDSDGDGDTTEVADVDDGGSVADFLTDDPPDYSAIIMET